MLIETCSSSLLVLLFVLRHSRMKRAWQQRHEPNIVLLEMSIEKDVTRTDSTEKFFKNKQTSPRLKLLHILMTYCVYHPEPGYVQGKSIALTLLNRLVSYFVMFRYDRYGSAYSLCYS
jgi:hypothetical protein